MSRFPRIDEEEEAEYKTQVLKRAECKTQVFLIRTRVATNVVYRLLARSGKIAPISTFLNCPSRFYAKFALNQKDFFLTLEKKQEKKARKNIFFDALGNNTFLIDVFTSERFIVEF